MIFQAKAQLEKLKEAEEKAEETAKSRIQAIQEKIDESAKGMTTQNEEHQKQKQELEEKCQNEIAKLEVPYY
jgi:flagellar biosynthesis chaperone FliJ